jgi:hypothetical protein
VISIEHLEPAKPDPYNRLLPETSPLVLDGVKKYIIDKIICRELRSVPGEVQRQVFYKVR